jgi:LPS export ABC transporter protein LptC
MADTADQVLFGMSYYVTVEGVRRARVEADTAFFYSPTQSAELRVVTVTFFGPNGEHSSTLTCREGTYRWRTGDMEGRGDVQVVTTDRRRLETPVLRYYQNRNEVESDTTFSYFKPPNEHVEGEGFVSDPNFRAMRVKRPHGRGTGFALPNQ